MTDGQLKHNDSSDYLPEVCEGPARHRHFARDVATVARFRVSSDEDTVYVHHGESDLAIDIWRLADKHDMALRWQSSTEKGFVHESKF